MAAQTTRWIFAAAVTAGSLFALSGCHEKKFKGALLLGECHVDQNNHLACGMQKVGTEQLEHGEEVYAHYCRPCHGDKGNGQGTSATALRPPPRDFRQGMFKFGSVTGGLPSQDDFKRIVRYGLKGTAMLPWDVEDHDLEAVISYIKTFSQRWQPAVYDQKTKKWGSGFKAGEWVQPTKPDPWTTANEAEGIDRGKYLYHVKAQCGSCHPNYVTRQELSDLNVKATGAGLTEFRDDMYGSVLKESQYKFGAADDLTGGYFVKLLPPDFTRIDTRSIRTQLGKTTAIEDLYRVIGGGINGTPMPAWKGTVFEQGHDADDDLWALAHYVYSLISLKGTPGAIELQMKLANQPAFTPPPPAPEPTVAPEGATEGAAPEGSSSAAPAMSASAAPATSTSAGAKPTKGAMPAASGKK